MTVPRMATALDLASCHDCGLLVRPGLGGHHADVRCPRCGAGVHGRKPNSLARTWALVIAAYILYVPANLLPVMSVTSLGKVQEDTILSGVFYLVTHGMWPLAVVVFVASFVVPLAKLVVLTALLISVHRRSRWRLADRTQLPCFATGTTARLHDLVRRNLHRAPLYTGQIRAAGPRYFPGRPPPLLVSAHGDPTHPAEKPQAVQAAVWR